jgi:enoyl-CoA hydratase/carnithine racemase
VSAGNLVPGYQIAVRSTQLDLETGRWTTAFLPEFTGDYRLRAALYDGNEITAAETIAITVVNQAPPPRPKEPN